jgi:hypothetical protein
MENEFEEAMIKFDESTLKNRFSCYFKLGVQVAVTSEVVTFKLV